VRGSYVDVQGVMAELALKVTPPGLLVKGRVKTGPTEIPEGQSF